jgi:hypothetical protein
MVTGDGGGSRTALGVKRRRLRVPLFVYHRRQTFHHHDGTMKRWISHRRAENTQRSVLRQ